MAGGARFESLDHSDLANAIRAEQEKKPAGPVAGITTLDGLDLDVKRVQGWQGNITARANAADDQIGRLDPRLKDSILSQMSREIRHAAADASDADLKAAYTVLESIREAVATHFDEAVLRRRARFHPEDAANATIVAAWMARVASAPDRVLVGLAADAFATSNLALGQIVREQAERRADREIEAEVRHHVDAIPVPGADGALKRLHAAEDAYSDAAERVRILRGGRPSGMVQIRRGLNELQRER